MQLGWLIFLAFGQGPFTVDGGDWKSSCALAENTENLVVDRLGEPLPRDQSVHLEQVHDSQTGKVYVRVRLLDADDAILLERLMPSTDDDCQDIPVAVAIILEGYYENLAAKQPEVPPSEEVKPTATEPVVDASPPAASNQPPRHLLPRLAPPSAASPSAAPPSAASPSAAPPTVIEPPRRSARLTLGPSLSSLRTLGLGVALDYFIVPHNFVTLTAHVQPRRLKIDEKSYSLLLTQHDVAVGSAVWLPIGDTFAFSIAPEIGLAFQGLELNDDATNSRGNRWRVSPTWGGRVTAEVALSRRVWLGAAARTNAAISCEHFVVRRPGRASVEIWQLPQLTSSAELFLAHWF